MKIISTFLFVLIAFLAHAQEWQHMADLPGQGRHHPVTFTLNGYGYLTTGVDSTSFTLNDFYKYDPGNDSWEELPDFPGLSRGFSYGDTYNGKAYMGFGRHKSDTAIVYLNDFWEYDPQTEQWTEKSSCPCLGRLHPAFVQLNGKIYVGLGNRNDGNGSYDLKDWWEYDIGLDLWMQKENLPGIERHHPFYFSADNKVYAGFGHHHSPGSSLILKDFYQYDPSTHSWAQMNDFPDQGRVAGTQFSYNDKGYILSGQGESHSNMELGEFWEYYPATDSWLELEPHPGVSARWAPGSFIIDGNVFLTCGLPDDGLKNDLWMFDLDPATSVKMDIQNEDSSLSVFPNPLASDQFQLKELENLGELDKISLVNSLGQKVSTVRVNGAACKLDNYGNLPPGYYYLSVVFKNGRREVVSISLIK